MTGRVSRDDVVFYGSRVAAGDLPRERAAEELVEVASYRISIREALQLIDTWQGYLAPAASFPAARRAFLARLFTRRTRRTTNPKGTGPR